MWIDSARRGSVGDSQRSQSPGLLSLLLLLLLPFFAAMITLIMGYGDRVEMVSGTVLDHAGEPIPAAKVMLYTESDADHAASYTTDKSGSFHVTWVGSPRDSSDAILKVEMVGYIPYQERLASTTWETQRTVVLRNAPADRSGD